MCVTKEVCDKGVLTFTSIIGINPLFSGEWKYFSPKNFLVSLMYVMVEPSRRVYHAWVGVWAAEIYFYERLAKCTTVIFLVNNPKLYCNSSRFINRSRSRCDMSVAWRNKFSLN